MHRRIFQAVLRFLAVPWAAFVAAFLYYVGLTMVAIGVEEVSDRFMAITYLVPVAGYAGVLLMRAVHAIPPGVVHPAAARHA